MEELLSADRLLAVWNTVYGWLLTNVLVLDNAVQAGLVDLTLLLAVLFARRLRPWLARYRDHRNVGRGVVIAEIAGDVRHLARAAVARDDRPRAQRAAERRCCARPSRCWPPGSRFISPRSSFAIRAWAKLIAWAAWSIAALSILDLLEPTIAVLDSAAIPVGELGDLALRRHQIDDLARRAARPWRCIWRA